MCAGFLIVMTCKWSVSALHKMLIAISAHLRFMLPTYDRPGLKCLLLVHCAIAPAAPKAAVGLCCDCVVIVIEVVVDEAA